MDRTNVVMSKIAAIALGGML